MDMTNLSLLFLNYSSKVTVVLTNQQVFIKPVDLMHVQELIYIFQSPSAQFITIDPALEFTTIHIFIPSPPPWVTNEPSHLQLDETSCHLSLIIQI